MFISVYHNYRELILLVLNDGDAPTLVETARLLHACISSKEARQPWLHAIKQNETVFPNITFILSSSTNSKYHIQ